MVTGLVAAPASIATALPVMVPLFTMALPAAKVTHALGD